MSSHRENAPNTKPSVCRRLFTNQDEPSNTIPSNAHVPISEPGGNSPNGQGDNSSNDLHDNMEEYIISERQRARERWNFDFETETPLDGDWEWERIEPQPQVARDEIARFEVEIGKVQSEEENHSL